MNHHNINRSLAGTRQALAHRDTESSNLSIEEMTIREALDAIALRAPARFYPEWACAEAFVLVLLLTGRRLPATTVLRRGTEVGLPEGAIRRAKVRLGVISVRQRNEWLWQLPADIIGESDVERVERPWQRWRDR